MELPMPSRPREVEHSVHVPVSTAMKATLTSRHRTGLKSGRRNRRNVAFVVAPIA